MHPDSRLLVRDVANAVKHQSKGVGEQGNSDPSEKADLSTEEAGLSERTGLSGTADEGVAPMCFDISSESGDADIDSEETESGEGGEGGGTQ